MSFLVGTLALLLAVAVVNGGYGNLAHISRAPWWALLGGLCGAVFVTIAIVTVRTSARARLAAAVVTGQLAVSVAIDRFGLLGSPSSRSARIASSGWRCWRSGLCWWSASRHPLPARDLRVIDPGQA